MAEKFKNTEPKCIKYKRAPKLEQGNFKPSLIALYLPMFFSPNFEKSIAVSYFRDFFFLSILNKPGPGLTSFENEKF